MSRAGSASRAPARPRDRADDDAGEAHRPARGRPAGWAEATGSPRRRSSCRAGRRRASPHRSAMTRRAGLRRLAHAPSLVGGLPSRFRDRRRLAGAGSGSRGRGRESPVRPRSRRRSSPSRTRPGGTPRRPRDSTPRRRRPSLQRSASRRSMSSSRSSMRVGRFAMFKTVLLASDGMRMPLWTGPRCPAGIARRPPVELLLERGYTACEIDFEGGFWMKPEWEWAEALRRARRRTRSPSRSTLRSRPSSVILEADEAKRKRAIGMIDHSAGSRPAVGAELMVVHPGYPARPRAAAALESVAEDLAELRERLEPKGRTVAFGVEIMGASASWARPRTSSGSPRASTGSGPCSTSRTCTRLRTGLRLDEAFPRRPGGRGRRDSSPAPRSTSTSRHRLREPQRDEAPPRTARARFVPSPCAPRSSASTARRR